MGEEDMSAEDQWQDKLLNASHQFGLAIRELHETNPWPSSPVLHHAINDLMTELWDHGFSQTDIRAAFLQAIADMPRYTGNQDVRP
jgi:hypothetical protein